ncbi:MAG: hypothetical protein EB090_02640 [Verrucomicrobia bacterium]|nr:hypothetical protein [Verrucomicrobiota bacterium]
MKVFPLIIACFLPWILVAQSTDDLSQLPSTRGNQKIPNFEDSETKTDFPETAPSQSISIPRPRPPEQDEKKNKNEDWVAQGVKEKQEAAKKKQEEEAFQAETKAREMSAQEQVKTVKKTQEGSPAISKSAAESSADLDKSRLPAVTGLDGVKPRASDLGDGRVKPGFDSFTGPSSSSPMGKDYQSGAKPIMPAVSSTDGRMMLPPKAPEPPSGAYKKISEDPNAVVPKTETAKTVAPSKPKFDGNTTPPGNPLTPGQPAGLSPYDNTRNVPDPRSTRRF